MDRGHGAKWGKAELAGLFEEYFGDKLAPPQLEQLTELVAAGLDERGRLESDE